MNKWVNYYFESSSGLTDDFASFAKDFRAYLIKLLGSEYQVINFNRGHFYVSGFVFNKTTKNHAYFSSSDVRFFSNEWFNSLLVRTAKDNKDFSGGRNNFCKLDEIKSYIDDLTK